MLLTRKAVIWFSLLRSLAHENKMRPGDSWNADCTAVTTTTALNPCCGKLLFRLFTVWGKNNKMFLCASKQDFFQSEHSCDPKSLLPLLLSPFPGSSQPSFSRPCASCCLLAVFFPVLIFFFFFFSPLCGFRPCKCCRVPHLSLGWKASVCHWCLTEASASKETESTTLLFWFTLAALINNVSHSSKQLFSAKKKL